MTWVCDRPLVELGWGGGARASSCTWPANTGSCTTPTASSGCRRAVAEQCGWRLAGTIKLLERYGHHDIGALEEIDEAFTNVVAPLRLVE